MDLVSIQFVSGSVNNMLGFAATPTSGTLYGATTTGATATWITGNHVVQQGDMITVTITGLTLAYSTSASVKIVPAYGTSTLVSFVTPSYYSTALVNLR